MSETPIPEAPAPGRSGGADLAGGTAGPGLGSVHAAFAVAPRLFFVVGAALAILFWLVESAAHTWLLREGSYLDNLLPRDPNELWMRLLAVGLLLAGGSLSAGFARRLALLERRNEELHQRLEEALAKLISGFVPICMYCKSVRNPDERWERIETYLASHAEMKFSHGICPSCLSKHFPDDR